MAEEVVEEITSGQETVVPSRQKDYNKEIF